jgi:hypothetical protein
MAAEICGSSFLTAAETKASSPLIVGEIWTVESEDRFAVRGLTSSVVRLERSFWDIVEAIRPVLRYSKASIVYQTSWKKHQRGEKEGNLGVVALVVDPREMTIPSTSGPENASARRELSKANPLNLFS